MASVSVAEEPPVMLKVDHVSSEAPVADDSDEAAKLETVDALAAAVVHPAVSLSSVPPV